jgi:hypothetical protein
LDCRTIGERITKRHTQFDNVRASLGKSQNEFQRGFQRRITSGNVRDDAKFAGLAQGSKPFMDSRLQDLAL